ncbi:hypothetical protein CAEBREN_04748 [Caenorhabditis brenneri]|uniref:BHLH domain-containing protein n=1 Tax=Caenorhabditis brenneri TaxID=135651 RepID=G0M9S8_CAEBE|nr:hypothetical protein CAEBREN_04748 [Caenorhabditis brenneri]
MSFLAMYNATINPDATGAPPALPVIPPATLEPSSSTSNTVATPTFNHKANKEHERRDLTNQRFAELQQLVRKDYNGKMSQADILKAALKAAIKTKREFYTDPRSRGVHTALEKTEHVAIQYLKSSNLPRPTYYITSRRVEKMFEDFRDIFMPVFIPKAAPESPPAPSATGPSASEDAEMARKEIRAKREQARRDNQSDGFGLLKQFIDENKLVKRGDQKIHILECIIAYLKWSTISQPSQLTASEFVVGFTQGRHIGQNLAAAFFKSDAQLSTHTEDLHKFFTTHLGAIDPASQAVEFKFDKDSVLNFMALHPAILDLMARITPPPTVPSTPVPTPKFHRPWE